MKELMNLLYTSELAPGESPACIAEMVHTAGTRNAQADVSGVLLFDGSRFCHYLEGKPGTLLPLLAIIEMDRCHKDVRVRHLGALNGPRRFVGWNTGYMSVSGQSLDEYFRDITGARAIAAFEALLPALDFPNSA